jgi:hypothetical protein
LWNSYLLIGFLRHYYSDIHSDNQILFIYIYSAMGCHINSESVIVIGSKHSNSYNIHRDAMKLILAKSNTDTKYCRLIKINNDSKTN